MEKSQKNKRILVTGASRGIGREVSLYLAKNGYDLLLHYNSNEEKALSVKNEAESLGVLADVVQFDIKDRKNVLRRYPKIFKKMVFIMALF